MKLDYFRSWRSIPMMLVFGMSACTTNPDGTMSTRKTTAGAVAGAVVGLGVGVAVGGSTDKKRTKNAILGATTGAVLGAATGATFEYIDQEIQRNNIILSNKIDIELANIANKIHLLEKETNRNYHLIGENKQKAERAEVIHDKYDVEMKKLINYSSKNEYRTHSTNNTLRTITNHIEDIKKEKSSENDKLKYTLDKQKNELEHQKIQLHKQKKIINGLLMTIKEQNKELADKSKTLS